MKKLIAGGIAAVLALGLSAAVVAPANAAPYWWYHHHYHGGYWGGPGPALGLGFLGGAMVGAAIAGSAANARAADEDHVQACLDAYRSYDPRTDTYLGYDGYRHRCML